MGKKEIKIIYDNAIGKVKFEILKVKVILIGFDAIGKRK
jgi:hypothetical protein